MVISNPSLDEIEAALRRVPPDRRAEVLLFVKFLEYQASKEARDNTSEDEALWAAVEANQAYNAQYPSEMELQESGTDFLAVTSISDAVPAVEERGIAADKALAELSAEEFEGLIERTLDRHLNVWLAQLMDALIGSQEEENAEFQPEFVESLRRSLVQARSGEGIDLKAFRNQIT